MSSSKTTQQCQHRHRTKLWWLKLTAWIPVVRKQRRLCDEFMILVLFGSKCLTIQLAHRITGTSYRIGYVIQTSLKSHVFLVREKCELNPCREHRVRFQPVQRSWSPIVISFIIHASRTKSLDSVCLWH